MKMETYECIVTLLMISLCWGCELHPGIETTQIADDSQRGRSISVEEQPCPTWYRETKYNGVTRCVCGITLENNIMCNYTTQETLISSGYCMSYNDTTKDTVVGGCPFSSHHDSAQTFYATLPNDTSELNTFMCSSLNRTGMLCSKCQKGLGTAVLSYKWQCVECFDKRYGWLVYLAATLFPATILCLLVMVFQLHVTSTEMNVFVFLCQYIPCVTALLSPYAYTFVYSDSRLTAIHFFLFALLSFYGIWNLDFFQYFIPAFCISSDMSTLHTLALEYIVAVYPLLLTLVIYVCIEMYDRGVRVVVCVWSPFRVCFARFRRRWNPKGSVINTFATFLLLSYSKLLTVSYQLLDASTLYNITGKAVGPAVLYYDASTVYFSRQHLPFALLALSVLLVFVAFPLLLLLLYPMRSFQRCLGYCTRIRWQFLHTFADAFQGCYKNGTNGTRDYRYFAGLYLLFRVILLVGFITQTSAFRWLIIIPVPVVISLLFALFRPYKNNFFNIIDCLAFALVALATFLIMYTYTTHVYYYFQLLYVMILTPFLYFISFILYKILSQVTLFRACCSRIKKMLQATNDNQHQHIQRGSTEDLPDRVVNPDMYQPLLPATNSSSSGEGDSQGDSQPQVGVNSLMPYGSM